MIYRVIGVAGSDSPQGLDILFTELTETGGKWSHEIIAEASYNYDSKWKSALESAANLPVLEYQRLHASFGRYIGKQINHFIGQNELEHRVDLVAFNGHTVFHLPGQSIIAQLGHGAFVAAETGLPVVCDLFSFDIALGGQAAPLAAATEKLLAAGETTSPYPAALVIALMGVLRWREEANMLSSLTGASRDSCGGALWLGTDD